VSVAKSQIFISGNLEGLSCTETSVSDLIKALLQVKPDLKEIFKDKNLVVAIKCKKFNKIKTPKKYLKLFDNKLNLRILSPEYSAWDIINSSKLIISFPYSSTAILAKKLKKQSIYYFPDKIINKPWVDENIKIIEGHYQLKKYINEMIF